MYYLKPEADDQVQIFAFEPEQPYVAAEELPQRPKEESGYYFKLRVDIEAQKAWYEKIELPPVEPMPPPEPTPDPLEELREAVRILSGGADDELD